MIQLSRNYSLPEQDDVISIKIVGVGGAGSNALDRIVLDGMEKAELIATNTDVQSLASSVAASKVQLGRSLTRGLGTGGDPELGYEAAVESADEIRQELTDARMVFVCAGLGGGTGSGAAPLIAQIAREAGSLVIGFATMPFSFEGKRRTIQAQEALARLQKCSDAVVCFDNDCMGDIVAPKAGIHQAFAVADVTISQSVRSIVNVIRRPGIIRIGFDDLLSALRSRSGRCVFGFGESDSDNRAHEALEQALKNPLMDRGRMLADAGNVLVQIAGGPGMTLSEVEIVMQELGRHIDDHTQILFGTAVDGRMGNRLSVTIISSVAALEEIPPIAARPVEETVSSPPPAAPVAPLWEYREEPAAPVPVCEQPIAAVASPPPVTVEPEPIQEAVTAIRPVEAELRAVNKIEDFAPEPPPPPVVEPPPRLILPKKKPTPASEVKPPVERIQARQEVLQFEAVTRGRFEKSEPTIVEGQDLDVPTFLRKNVRVK